MKYSLSIFCFFLMISGFSQIMMIDSTSAHMTIEIKKDMSGKYIKRIFKDTKTGDMYEYEANPEKFSIEVQDDVIRYLRKKQKRFDENHLQGIWHLKSVTDLSGILLNEYEEFDLNERLQFTKKTKAFLKMPFYENSEFLGCYSLNSKKGLIETFSSEVIIKDSFQAKEKEHYSKPCIKSDNINGERLSIYTLNPEHLVLYKFIPHSEDIEYDQTILLHYIKVLD